jgi:hypothetical protein
MSTQPLTNTTTNTNEANKNKINISNEANVLASGAHEPYRGGDAVATAQLAKPANLDYQDAFEDHTDYEGIYQES